MKITNEEYKEMVSKCTPPSPCIKNSLLAFAFGGSICVLGQVLMNMFLSFGFSQKDASTLVSVVLVFLGSFLTAIKVYDNIAKHAGAGTLVPITGFANSVVAPAIEFKSEGHVLGIGAKMFVISGPVILFGVVSSVLYGLLVYVLKILKII